VKSAELAVISEEKRDATGLLQWPFLVLTVKFIRSRCSSPSRFAKIFFGIGCFFPPGGSDVFENQRSTFVQKDFGCLPCGTLVDVIEILRLDSCVPRLIEPIQVGFVVRDPFLDGSPGRLDALETLDIERWRRRSRQVDHAFPESMETEKEFDLLAAQHRLLDFHRAVAAGTFERIAAPDL